MARGDPDRVDDGHRLLLIRTRVRGARSRTGGTGLAGGAGRPPPDRELWGAGEVPPGGAPFPGPAIFPRSAVTGPTQPPAGSG